MTAKLLDVLKIADDLSAEEQMVVIAHLAQRRRLQGAGPGEPKLQWAQLRGRVNVPMTGEDAQAWVSRSRGEDQQKRDQR